ncbi:MAG: hypothetical protein QXK37_00895 [Candidatus Woesearchaeota archaeon]
MRGVLYLVIFCLFGVFAAAIGVSPSTITAENMARGDYFEKEVFVSGLELGDKISISIQGPASGWIETGKESYTAVGEKTPILFKIKVPESTPNGEYTAQAVISSSPKKADEGGAAVQIRTGVSVAINIEVTGEQVREYSVSDSSLSASSDGLMVLMLNVVNSGNVQVGIEQVQIYVYDKFKKTLLLSRNITKDMQKEASLVEPHMSGTVEMSIAHGLPPGEYWAVISVQEGNKVLYTREMLFTVRENTGSRISGVLNKISMPEYIRENEMVRISGFFQNIGDAQVSARLVCEVYKGASLVKISESMESVVDKGASSELIAYFKPEQPGEHLFKCYVGYNGYRTDYLSSSLVVGDQSTNYSYMISIGLVIVVLLVLLSAIVVFRRWKRKR